MSLRSENNGFADIKKYRDLLICMFLAAAILVTYWQVQYYGLTCYDDLDYITGNPHIKNGFTWDSITWAMTYIRVGYWHPVTWLSHMLDYQLFRSNAGGYHWVNVIFHIANAILLYILLKRTSGDVWKSAFVAALFAVHPLNVESVAWIAERKNVLSTFFWFMAMLSYAYYVERPTLYRYSLILFAFSLGLMAKPMLVTLPFTLLLFDYWPLGRLTSWKALPRLVFEKIPLFLLSIIVSIITFLTCRHEGAVISFDKLPFLDRIANVLVSYSKYMGKSFWPQNLAVFYPYSKEIDLFQIVGAATLLITISCVMIFLARHYRYTLVGWLWYLGTLVPVIGLVQAGEQAMADRYAYIPTIGLFVIIAWGVPDLLKKWPQRKIIIVVSSGIILSGLIICTLLQVRYWQNSVTLFEHALHVTHDNLRAHNNLGVALNLRGESDKAIKYFEYVIKRDPEYSAAYSNMGIALAKLGKTDEAMVYYCEALRIKPNDESTHNNLGVAFANKGKFDEATEHFREALKIRPDYAHANLNMGGALVKQGKIEEAIDYYEKALQLDRDNAKAHNNLGIALIKVGRLDKAIEHFTIALKINPYYLEAYSNLQAVLKTIDNPKKISEHP